MARRKAEPFSQGIGQCRSRLELSDMTSKNFHGPKRIREIAVHLSVANSGRRSPTPAAGVLSGRATINAEATLEAGNPRF
jgi:hypothetical protein